MSGDCICEDVIIGGIIAGPSQLLGMCVHMHVCTCLCTCVHVSWNTYVSMCVCMYWSTLCACACVHCSTSVCMCGVFKTCAYTCLKVTALIPYFESKHGMLELCNC